MNDYESSNSSLDIHNMIVDAGKSAKEQNVEAMTGQPYFQANGVSAGDPAGTTNNYFSSHQQHHGAALNQRVNYVNYNLQGQYAGPGYSNLAQYNMINSGLIDVHMQQQGLGVFHVKGMHNSQKQNPYPHVNGQDWSYQHHQQQQQGWGNGNSTQGQQQQGWGNGNSTQGQQQDDEGMSVDFYVNTSGLSEETLSSVSDVSAKMQRIIDPLYNEKQRARVDIKQIMEEQETTCDGMAENDEKFQQEQFKVMEGILVANSQRKVDESLRNANVGHDSNPASLSNQKPLHLRQPPTPTNQQVYEHQEEAFAQCQPKSNEKKEASKKNGHRRKKGPSVPTTSPGMKDFEVLDISKTLEAIKKGNVCLVRCPYCVNLMFVDISSKFILCDNCQAVSEVTRDMIVQNAGL